MTDALVYMTFSLHTMSKTHQAVLVGNNNKDVLP